MPKGSQPGKPAVRAYRMISTNRTQALVIATIIDMMTPTAN